MHPDKRHQGGAAERETAARRFAHVQEAYSVLSDPEKRDVYDVYGLEGLRAGLEVGHPLHRAEDIKREFRRFKEEQERERREQRVAYRGQYVFGFAVAPLVDSDPRPPQEQPVQILSSAMNTNASYAVTDADVLTVGGQAAVRGGLGGGNLFLAWRRQITALSTLDASAVVGHALSSTVTSSQRLSKHTRARCAPAPRPGGLRRRRRRRETDAARRRPPAATPCLLLPASPPPGSTGRAWAWR